MIDAVGAVIRYQALEQGHRRQYEPEEAWLVAEVFKGASQSVDPRRAVNPEKIINA